MRTTAWILFLLALGVLAALGGLVFSVADRDPRELLESAERLASGPERNSRAALGEFDFALRIAEAEADPELIADIRVARGRLLQETGALGQARADFESVLTTYRPGDLDVEESLVEIDLAAEAYTAALERADRILALDPERARAWRQRARVLVRLAEGRVEECRALCESSMPDENVGRAAELVEQASCLFAGDPRRATVIYQIRELFPATEVSASRQVQQLLSEASRHVAAAREALAQSFIDAPDRDSLYDFMRLLRRSKRHDETVAFGLAAVAHRDVGAFLPFERELMISLQALGRPHTAAAVLNANFTRRAVPDLEFFETWASVLYDEERWTQLIPVAMGMRSAGDAERRSMASYYLGRAQIALGNHEEAVLPLTRFATPTDAHEPFPGALAHGWRMLASVYAERGTDLEEKYALRTALALPGAEETIDDLGAAWLRLAELILATEPGSLEEAQEALTRAICHDPAAADEILPRLEAVGRKQIARLGIDLNLVISELRANGRYTPEGDVTPYELLAMGRLHYEQGRPAGVEACARRLLDDYPGFAPMLRLRAEGLAMNAGGGPDLARARLELLETVGADSGVLVHLTQGGDVDLTGHEVARLVQVDPEGYGRFLLADTMRQRGRALEALVGLRTLPADALGARGDLLLAQLLSEEGHARLALETARRVPQDSPWYPLAHPLALRIAVAEEDLGVLSELLDEIEDLGAFETSLYTELVEEMWLADMAAPALSLLTRLDARPESRSGRTMMQLGMTAWLLGDEAQGLDGIARGHAYLTDGSGELGRLLAATDRHDWSALPWLVTQLRRSDYEPNRIQNVALDLLSENAERALTRIEDGRERTPQDPIWNLFAACVGELGLDPELDDHSADPEAAAVREVLFGRDADGVRRDARELLVRIVALWHPAWTRWAIADFDRTAGANRTSLWPDYLAARGYELLGRIEGAEENARAVVQTWPEFAPAWDLLERAVARRFERPDHPKVLRLQAERREALGLTSADVLAQAVGKAQVAEVRGQLDEALSELARALEIDPSNVIALERLGRIHRKRGEWRPAIASYSRAVRELEPVSDSPLVADFLEVLRRAGRSEPALLADGTIRVELDRLSEAFPDDPSVALARAQDEERAAVRGPTAGMQRALAQLDAFRRVTGGVPLDTLRLGAAAEWTAYHAERNPERALAFVHDELGRDPGNIDLWRLLGEAHAALGERDEAIEAYELVLKMLPDGKTARAIAALLAETGRDAEQVVRYIRYAVRLERLEERDLDMQLTIARSLVNGPPEARDRGIEVLERLWGDREALAKIPRRLADIGQDYGTALLWRADPKDKQLAHDVLAEVEPLIEDPARRTLVAALSNLALWIPPKAQR